MEVETPQHSSAASEAPSDSTLAAMSTLGLNRPFDGRHTSRSIDSMLELELLHHYSSSTHHAMGCLFELGDDIWQVYVVQEGFKHDFLLNGIFSLAALHIASQNVEPSSTFTLKASEYLEVALGKFRILLSVIQADNVDALFAFAIIISASMMVQLQASSVADIGWSCLVDKVKVVFECLLGVRKIVITGGQWLQNGPFCCILARLNQKEGVLLEPGPRSALLRLKNLSSNGSVCFSEPQKQLYSKVVDGLEACWLRRIFAMDWIIDAGTDFLVELRKEVPLAKLVFAHWGVSLHKLNHIWWAKGVGHSIVEHSTNGLEYPGTRFDVSMRWTRQQVGLDNK